jgi:hypothetical protein
MAQKRQKGYYDLKVKGPEIQVGDSVVYENETNFWTSEICLLRLPYKTPLYQVVQKLFDDSYQIALDGGLGPTKIVYVDALNQTVRQRSPRPSVPTPLPSQYTTTWTIVAQRVELSVGGTHSKCIHHHNCLLSMSSVFIIGRTIWSATRFRIFNGLRKKLLLRQV